MIFSLIILGSPGTHQSAQTAYRFAAAAIAQGHQIHRVFFYHDGVHNGSRLCTPPQGETSLPEQWHAFAQQHNIDLAICIASALRRGILNQEEADRFDKPAASLDERSFTLSGLGEMVDATENSDRILTFGC